MTPSKHIIEDHIFPLVVDTYLQGGVAMIDVIKQTIIDHALKVPADYLRRKVVQHPYYIDRLEEVSEVHEEIRQNCLDKARQSASTGLSQEERRAEGFEATDCTLFWSREKLIRHGYLRPDRDSDLEELPAPKFVSKHFVPEEAIHRVVDDYIERKGTAKAICTQVVEDFQLNYHPIGLLTLIKRHPYFAKRKKEWDELSRVNQRRPLPDQPAQHHTASI